MNATSQLSCALQRTIDAGEFYTADDKSIFQVIQQSFPAELDRLKNAYAVEGSNSSAQLLLKERSASDSPSRILYNHDFDEINRTLVGVQCLRWIHNDDYETLTGCQPEPLKLQRDSFNWLRDYFRENLRTSSDLFALILSMIINDLGKDPELAGDISPRTSAKDNHDVVLLEAAKGGLIPSLELLDTKHREDVMLGLELGSELNAGQLAQAENVPINLEGLLHMRGHEDAFALKFMEQILDVAGSGGHIDHTCAKRFIEPVFQAFKTVHEVSLDIIARKYTLREGYNKVLTNRGDMLVKRGFRRLSVHKPDERALLRLLTMGRTADRDQADLFSNAFHALSENDRNLLIQGLNVGGFEDETAVLPYYMPAIISEGLENIHDLPQEGKERAVAALMRYLGRVLEHKSSLDHSANPPSVNFRPGDEDGDDKVGELTIIQPVQRQGTGLPGVVIERNVRAAMGTIRSEEFRTNPERLDALEVPPGAMMKRRRTSHSMDNEKTTGGRWGS